MDRQLVTLENVSREKTIERPQASILLDKHIDGHQCAFGVNEMQVITPRQIELEIRKKNRLSESKLGSILFQAGHVTKAQLDVALHKQSKNRGKHLGEILVEMAVLDKRILTRVLAKKLGIPFIRLNRFQFDFKLIKQVPNALARKYGIVPLYRVSSRIVVALENPFQEEGLKNLEFLLRLKVDAVMASAEDIGAAIQQLYGSSIDDIVQTMQESQDEEAATESKGLVTESDNVLVRLVNKIITDAYELGVSDIHIESKKGLQPTRVRFRKDGLLSSYLEIPFNFRSALISRIKIMARLDISEKRHAQDGKIEFHQSGLSKVELRVVTIPTTDGMEDVVLRILTIPKAISLTNIGLAPYALEALKKLVVKPHGLLFVCGPTGSGKTTTLHALLGYINTADRKIWTAEDPIEITQPGLSQVQVQSKIDWNFAEVLRGLLRADPDVIMIGETRDRETAEIVLKASLTGHLVMSTLHTNSAVESVVRLLDLGLDPFNLADALLGVVGQRLVRKLCSACRQPYHATEEELKILAHEYCNNTEQNPAQVLSKWRKRFASISGYITLYRAHGCPDCVHTGYKGRLGIHEMLINSARVKKKIHARANVEEIFQVAASEGMCNLVQDGIQKILEGHTDWEQVKTL